MFDLVKLYRFLSAFRPHLEWNPWWRKQPETAGYHVGMLLAWFYIADSYVMSHPYRLLLGQLQCRQARRRLLIIDPAETGLFSRSSADRSPILRFMAFIARLLLGLRREEYAGGIWCRHPAMRGCLSPLWEEDVYLPFIMPPAKQEHPKFQWMSPHRPNVKCQTTHSSLKFFLPTLPVG
jgi:hypothetical protein